MANSKASSSTRGTGRKMAIFYLNGVRHQVGDARAGLMFSDYLRYERGLVATKVVCAEGDCGACSVLQLAPGRSSSPGYRPINSCIIPVAQLDGTSLITVDALAKGSELSPVQNAMVLSHGSQCGFCTPGFVAALSGLVDKKVCGKATSCTERETKNALTGNLCRCTGYQPIVDAAMAIDLKQCRPLSERFSSRAQLADLAAVRKKPLAIETDSFSFYAPRTLSEAAKYLRRHPDARIGAAATDLGVAVNKGKISLPRIVSLHLVDDLYRVGPAKKKGRISVGARVTLAELRRQVKKSIPEFARFLDLFASPQIKNTATLVGNVANASPIGDTPPFLLVANAVLRIVGPTGKREVPLEKFYIGYRKTVLRPGELIAAIEFDQPPKIETLALYKTSQRKDLDISAVNAAIRIEWKNRGRTRIKTAKIALGGVAATPIRVPAAETALEALSLDGLGQAEPGSSADRVVEALQASIRPLSDLRGSSAFRRVLVENFVRKFLAEHGPGSLVKESVG